MVAVFCHIARITYVPDRAVQRSWPLHRSSSRVLDLDAYGRFAPLAEACSLSSMGRVPMAFGYYIYLLRRQACGRSDGSQLAVATTALHASESCALRVPELV